MSTWEKPAFEELAMNAEIGAYQADDDERDPRPMVKEAQAEKLSDVPRPEGVSQE
jgi:hypothetical protein